MYEALSYLCCSGPLLLMRLPCRRRFRRLLVYAHAEGHDLGARRVQLLHSSLVLALERKLLLPLLL